MTSTKATPKKDSSITYFPVGNGDTSLIKLTDGTTVLIDLNFTAASDDDDGLADGDQHEDGGRQEEIPPAIGAEDELRIHDRGDDDDNDEGREDARLARPENTANETADGH